MDIERLGRQGDGVGAVDGVSVFVPFTLPGEQVIADVEGARGQLLKVLASSPERIKPACPHFGTCGGCALQHFHEEAAARWKTGQVAAALRAQRLEAPVHPVIGFAGEGRRRAVLKARRTRKSVLLGFHGRRSGQVIAIESCPVLHPEITGLLPGLGQMIAVGLTRRGEASVHILWSLEGADIAVEGGREVDLRLREHLGGWAAQLNLARLSWNGELIARREIPPVLQFGKARVTPPPGSFVQALEAAEHKMSAFVTGWLAGADHVVDLFCGCGAFSLPVAQYAPVLCVDSDLPALEALAAAAARTSRIRPVETSRRNLLNSPLRVDELERFDAAIFDPPRGGAKAQCLELAGSRVSRVAAISCNPVSFARDARILVDGGFELVEVYPIDQFRFSPHIELAALFRRH